MTKRKIPVNRMIQMKDGVVGPTEPKLKTVKFKMAGDYQGVPEAYLEIAGHYGPGFYGPRLCDELLALVQHMFTEDEAAVIRHLKPNKMMSDDSLAESAKVPVEEAGKILKHLAGDLHIIVSLGDSYLLLPILPGVFELVLVRQSMDSLTDWHRRFAELFEALWECGSFMGDGEKFGGEDRIPGVRFLPAQIIMKGNPMALPSDMLEEVLEPYTTFAIGLCQCRLTEDIVGRGCERTIGNCGTMGLLAEMAIGGGMMRSVEKKEFIEIKLEAEAEGFVNWIQTRTTLPNTNTMCSCCGCCCHAMRTITEFNMPGMVAPPHFMPAIDSDKCISCGNCARSCPMGAITIDTKEKTQAFEPLRCVGCGQCFIACDKTQAITLEPVKDYVQPEII